MVYKNFDQLMKAVGNTSRKKVVLAGAHDPHALEAVLKAEQDGLIDYMLVGKSQEIQQISGELGYKVDAGNILDIGDPESAAAASVDIIRRGEGDFLMKGKMETATLLKAVVDKRYGITTGRIMSHVAILEIPSYHKLLATTDGGMILYPDLEQKKAILKNAIELFHALGYDCPKAGVMAAIEVVNEKMRETIDGAELKRLANEENYFGRCLIEGPISFDLAVSATAAEIKGYNSPVAGDVDIMLMPDITSGNLTTKGLYCLGGARMAGCVIGAAVPIVLSSRGATFEEKYISLLLCAALVKNNDREIERRSI